MTTAGPPVSENPLPISDVVSRIGEEETPYPMAELQNPPGDRHEQSEMATMFRRFWCAATDDSRLTLFGFRRFRTTHLLNLRFLENEIIKIDRDIFQAGLQLDVPFTASDRLGLKHGRKDKGPPTVEALVKPELISRLRDLLKEYDDTLLAFNQIMTMETDNGQSNPRSNLNLYESYKTRLLRVDLPPRRDSRDPLRVSLRKSLRAIRFHLLSGRARDSEDQNFDSSAVDHSSNADWETRSSAEFFTRFLVALIASAFLIVPLALLSLQSSNKAHLITVSVFIIVFAFIVSFLSKASNSETMAAAAAYAAVLVVFVSNSSGNNGTG